MIRNAFLFFSTMLFLAACAGSPGDNEVLKPDRVESGLTLSGTQSSHKTWFRNGKVDLSGMAAFGHDRFLLVHDSKNNKVEIHRPRLGVLILDRANKSSNYREVLLQAQDWQGVGGMANDLEAVCRVPGARDEFLLMESGYYQGRFGRLLHVRLKRPGVEWQVDVLGALPLPQPDRQGLNFNFEALLCLRGADGTVQVVLGERGAGRQRLSRLLWNVVDLHRHRYVHRDRYEVIRENIEAPGWKEMSEKIRHIADLYVDDTGVLWAASAYDPDVDEGPFASVLYRAGTLQPGTPPKVIWNPDPRYQRHIGRYKIEALGPPLSSNCRISAGTDDEMFGGRLFEWFCDTDK